MRRRETSLATSSSDVAGITSARALIGALGNDAAQLPVVLFPDGTMLVTPTNRQLAEKIGPQTRAQLPFYDVAIVGGGPAGLAAAVYAASEGLKTLMVE
jgi:thioredoxin reductase (NADPH)